MLETAITYVLENKEWIFSGIGVFVITTAPRFLKRTTEQKIKQTQKSGDSSVSVQIGNIEKK